jgi:hypothetical protein
MTIGEEIRQAIRNIVMQYLVTSKLREPKVCKVLTVNAGVNSAIQVCDCKPLDGSAIVRDVTLITSYQNNQAGFMLVPKVNSLVQVSFNDDCDAFVSMVSVVDFIYLNGNDYGGLVQVQPLVDKLNNLENKVNSLITFTQTHTHSGVTVGSGVTGTASPPVTGDLTTTQKNDLENTTVLHGTGNLG